MSLGFRSMDLWTNARRCHCHVTSYPCVTQGCIPTLVLVLYSNCSSCQNQTRLSKLLTVTHSTVPTMTSPWLESDLSKCLFCWQEEQTYNPSLHRLHTVSRLWWHSHDVALLRTVARIQFVGSGRFGEVSWLLIVSALIEAFVLMGALEWAGDSHSP